MTNTNWTTGNIPNQDGKIALITGANSGLGFETARALARKGARVIMAVRNLDKGQAAIENIRRETPDAQLDLLHVDLASLDSVRAFADAVREQYDELHILVNNAGVMALPGRRETEDGFEMQFGVNHLGAFALTGHLLGLLLATPGARVVAISSFAHKMYPGGVSFGNLNSEKRYWRWEAYGLSKLANLLFTYELQRRLAAAGADAIAVAAHPGYTHTNLQQYSGFFSRLNHLAAQTPEMGALPILYAATAPDVVGGGYYGPDGPFELRGYPKRVSSSRTSRNETTARRLWEVSEEMTGVSYDVLDRISARAAG